MSMYLDGILVVEHVVEYGVEYESAAASGQTVVTQQDNYHQAVNNAKRLSGKPVKRDVYVGEWGPLSEESDSALTQVSG